MRRFKSEQYMLRQTLGPPKIKQHVNACGVAEFIIGHDVVQMMLNKCIGAVGDNHINIKQSVKTYWETKCFPLDIYYLSLIHI